MGLNYRQRLFVAAYLGEAQGNASEAASTAGLAAITLSSNVLAQSAPSVSLSFAPAGNICDYNGLPDYKIYVGAGRS